MYALAIRQWLSHLWDNLFPLIVLNVLSALTFSVFFLVPSLVWGVSLLVYTLSLLAAIVFVSVLSSAINRSTFEMSESRPFRFRQFFEYFRSGMGFYFVLGVVFFVAVLVVTQMFPFYASIAQTWSFLALVVLALGLAIGILIFGLWGPMKARNGGSFPNVVSRSLVVALRFPGWALFVLLGQIVIVTVSTLTVSLFPGIGGLYLWHQVTYRILEKKIKTLEAANSVQQWSDFLKEEKALLVRSRKTKK